MNANLPLDLTFGSPLKMADSKIIKSSLAFTFNIVNLDLPANKAKSSVMKLRLKFTFKGGGY